MGMDLVWRRKKSHPSASVDLESLERSTATRRLSVDDKDHEPKEFQSQAFFLTVVFVTLFAAGFVSLAIACRDLEWSLFGKGIDLDDTLDETMVLGEQARQLSHQLPKSLLQDFQRRLSSPSLEHCIIIPTVKRVDGVYYLTRTVLRLLEEIKSDPSVAVILFNAQKEPLQHSEAVWLSNFIPMVNSHSAKTDNHHRNEYADYIQALKTCRHETKAKLISVFQDDVLIIPRFFQILRKLIKDKIAVNPTPWVYIRPYLPLQWLGYARKYWFEQCQNVVCSAIIGVVLVLLYLRKRKSSHHGQFSRRSQRMLVFLAALYSGFLGGVFPLIYGRVNVLNLRLRLFGDEGYIIKKADDCCIPIATYSSQQIDKVIEFLATELENFDKSTEKDKKILPIDNSLAVFAKKAGMRDIGIEPNMAIHIGLFSTLNHSFWDAPAKIEHEDLIEQMS
jgi:hypothetical protein